MKEKKSPRIATQSIVQKVPKIQTHRELLPCICLLSYSMLLINAGEKSPGQINNLLDSYCHSSINR